MSAMITLLDGVSVNPMNIAYVRVIAGAPDHCAVYFVGYKSKTDYLHVNLPLYEVVNILNQRMIGRSD